MDDQVTRRDLLARMTPAVGIAALSLRPAEAAQIGDIKPSLYSITYLGYWYHGKALTMEELLQRAKAYGYEGLEIEGKRPHGCPLDWPKQRCHEFRNKAEDAGIAITNVAGNNDFSSPVPEHREANLVMVRDMLRMSSDLGSKIFRIYLAWSGATRKQEGGARYDIAQKMWDVAHEDFSEDQTWDWCRQGLIEAARLAGDYGVTLALQNHKPITTTYKIMLRMIKEVDSPHLKACMDAPLMEDKSPEYLRKAVHEVGKLQIHTHFGGQFQQEAPGKPIRRIDVESGWRKPYIHRGISDGPDFNLPFVRALLETGYRGYTGYELCSPLPVANGRVVGLEYADRNAKIGAEYMRGVIAQAKRELAEGKVSG